MINLPKVVMALFGKSAVLDIAEKIHNWAVTKRRNKKSSELLPHEMIQYYERKAFCVNVPTIY